MHILYKKKSLKDILENKELGIREYGASTYGKALEFKRDVKKTETLGELKETRPGLQIHRKKKTKRTFIAYLNIKWRIEFEYNKGVANIVTISRIHPHKYK